MNVILDFLWEIVQGFIDAGIKFLGNILMGFCSVALKIVNSATNQKNDLYDNICSAFNSVFWFSNNVLIWFGLFILTIGLIWGLSKIILSGQKGTKDDPIALVRRTIVAGILIYASPILVVFCLGHSINKDVEGKNEVISYEKGMTVMPNLLTGLSSFDGAGKLKPSKGTITAINNSQDTNADILVKGAQEIGIKNVTAEDVGLGAKNTITEDSSAEWTTKEGKELRDYASSQGIETKKKNKKGKSVNKSDDELKTELAKQEYSFSTNGESVLDALSQGMYVKYGNSGWAKGILWRILYVIIFLIQPAMIVWNLVQMIWVFVKRAVSLILTACLAPVAIAFYPSQSTTEVTSRWVKMLVGYSLTTVLTFAFVKLGSFVYAAAITVQYQEQKLILTIALNFACLAVLGFVKEMEQYANNLGGNLVSFKNGISGQLGKLASSWGQRALFTPLNLAKSGVSFGARKLPTAVGFMSGKQGFFSAFGRRNMDRVGKEMRDNANAKAERKANKKAEKNANKFMKNNPYATELSNLDRKAALDSFNSRALLNGDGTISAEEFRGARDKAGVSKVDNPAKLLDGYTTKNGLGINQDMIQKENMATGFGASSDIESVTLKGEYRDKFKGLLNDKGELPVIKSNSNPEYALSTDSNTIGFTGKDGALKVVEGQSYMDKAKMQALEGSTFNDNAIVTRHGNQHLIQDGDDTYMAQEVKNAKDFDSLPGNQRAGYEAVIDNNNPNDLLYVKKGKKLSDEIL